MILIPNFGGMLIKQKVKKYTLIIVLTIGMISLWSCNYERQDKMGAADTHVVVIGFDGLSPDGLQNAHTPTFDKLISEGASTMHARAVLPTSSSTNWASMIMGAGPEQHGITSNSWEKDNLVLPAVTQSEPFLFPSIFHLIREQRKSEKIGAIYHWGGFGRLFEKSAVDFNENSATEEETAVSASSYIKVKNPLFTFIHFDHIDHAGHEFGHGTKEYYASVEKGDSLLAKVMKAIAESDLAGNTMVVVSSDHGGTGKGHGGESLDEVEIPFILWGKGIKKNYQIKYPVYQYDNAATVAHALNIKTPRAWIGKPVLEAFEGEKVADDYPVLVPLKKPELQNPAKGYAADGGLYTDFAELILKNPNTKGEIKYTLDGSMPKSDADTFRATKLLKENTVVKSAVFVDGKLSSAVSEAYFRIKPNTHQAPISYEVFHLDNLSFIPSIGNRKPDATGAVFEFSSEEVRQHIQSNTLFRFKSILEISTDDNYNFATRSDDGSQLFIDGDLVVDNDGDHGVRTKNGSIALEKGNHTVEVLWFNGGGDGWLDVYVKSDEIPNQILSTNLLRKN
ncbi:alkaline phosphatase family protein [Maribacter ulvicola]|uniref:Chitobiase/beta-hexosaminidase C-terminal domain-containing protein n=1 Tax=Maribacter ulvicola TaxID=228959 RepID=A0A1N6RLD7_9FLAO|nr:alkaline phosphatase family protein [Maribacter ulvicola]SIQ29700.1 Chitobiase/beta-hexosaminidase C-terminal domain-containing protein [Maribacter ulvicola]